MSRSVNELQVRVLRWIAEGCPADRTPTPGSQYKTSAVALQNRKLVKVTRRGDAWRAEVTEKGRNFLESGAATASSNVRTTDVVGRGTSASKTQKISAEMTVSESAPDQPVRPRRSNVTDARPSSDRGVPVVTQIRSPHPAVKELLDYPARVDLPAELRRRVHLISHMLVQEALRRGWKVTAVTSQRRPSFGDRGKMVRFWSSNDLFQIDAGERAVGIQFRVKTTRQDHVETPEETRKKAESWWFKPPRYDFVPTDLLRLFLYYDTRSVTHWQDSPRIPIEHRIGEALNRIESATKQVVAARQSAHQQQELAKRRREEEQRQQRRVADYDEWLNTLLELRDRVRQHRELTDIISGVESGTWPRECGGDQRRIDKFASWAHTYLAESEPFNGIAIPDGDPPDMTFPEWVRWKSYFEKRRY